MPKKKPYQKKSFESVGNSNDISANIYMSMILSEAWQDLSPKQQQVYLYCKLQFYGQSGRRGVDATDNSKFYFNRSLWQDTYKLYGKGSEGRFYKDITALIEHGFIRCIETGQVSRTKSIYQFSDKWKVWNTDKFELLPCEMNTPMLKALRAKDKKV